MRESYVTEGVYEQRVVAEAEARVGEATFVHYHSYNEACSSGSGCRVILGPINFDSGAENYP